MHTATITISNRFTDTGVLDNTQVKVPIDGNLYAELSNAGINLSSGCLAGSCGVCTSFILENPENLKNPGAVETDTIAHIKNEFESKNSQTAPFPIRLPCRAKVKGDVTIAPFKIKS